jgi:transcriptional regulator GlxA family with amidase domain
LTAKSQVPDKIQGFEKGANDYIVKPFSAEEVLARIKSQLKFKRLRDKLLRANLNLKGQRKVLTDTSKVKVEAVKEFLDENYNDDITREELAEEAGMSPDHLGKMFKQYTDVKISDYINQKRVEHAAQQLRDTQLKIIDIAFNVGFGSLRSFNQVFRDMMGDSPSNYRKKNKN